jgi:hypothetical protein
MKDGDETDRELFNSIYGVVFFGVPNQGIRIEHWLPMVKGQANENLIRDLGPHSTYLRTVHDEFRGAFSFPDYAILAVYETEKSKVAKVGTVEPSMNFATYSNFYRKRSRESGHCLETPKYSSLLTRQPITPPRINASAIVSCRSRKTTLIWSSSRAHMMKPTK